MIPALVDAPTMTPIGVIALWVCDEAVVGRAVLCDGNGVHDVNYEHIMQRRQYYWALHNAIRVFEACDAEVDTPPFMSEFTDDVGAAEVKVEDPDAFGEFVYTL